MAHQASDGTVTEGRTADDLYRILQVDPDAEQEVISAAYRRLAAKYHPDVNGTPEAARRMREINRAHEILGDAEARRAYDRSRAARWFGGAAAESPPTAAEAPKSALEQIGRSIAMMLVYSAVITLLSRMIGGQTGMAIALLIILVLVLWKGQEIMRYFRTR